MCACLSVWGGGVFELGCGCVVCACVCACVHLSMCA